MVVDAAAVNVSNVAGNGGSIFLTNSSPTGAIGNITVNGNLDVNGLDGNGGTIPGARLTARGCRGHAGLGARQAREPGLIQGERIGLGRDGSRDGGRPAGEDQ